MPSFNCEGTGPAPQSLHPP